MSIEIVGDIIKSALALNIRTAFSVTVGEVTTYPTIYKELIIQDAVYPSFFIWSINTTQAQISSDSHMRTYLMNVRYSLPQDSNGVYSALTSVAEVLLDTLDSINVPIYLGKLVGGVPVLETKPVRGYDIDFKIEEDVLQFFVTYKIKAKKVVNEDAIYMASLELNNI
jgi:hypothetical protein